MNIFMLGGLEDELCKIAGAKLLGAGLGAGLSALGNFHSELGRRHAEDYFPDKARVSAIRKERLKRMGLETALATAAGAGLGHLGTKALRDLGGKAVSQAKTLGKTLGKDLANDLQKATTNAIKDSARAKGERGVFWQAINPFKRKG
jgi:hypothetical protein